ncbi:hypothetical protein EDD11_001209 [Mortierella claussenii]|nr:hypothetical protein EDD11_001209 [Mortierella claussenii]
MDDAGISHNHRYVSMNVNGNSNTNSMFDNQRMKYLRTLVPSEVRRRLSFHLDECWFVHFSPSAEYMASIGLDHSINLWKDLMTPDPSVYKTVSFLRTVTDVEWSPDSKYLLANLGYDIFHPEFMPELNLIDAESGETLFKTCYKNDTPYVWTNAIAWFTDSDRFLTALDGLYAIWNVKGEMIREYTVRKDLTAIYMKLIPGKDEFVIHTTAHTIEIISFNTNDISVRQLDCFISITMAMNVSRDGTYLALSMKMDKELHRPAQIALYDLNTMTFLKFFEAESFIHEKFVIIPAFAGPNLELICAGSENGKLHFWDVESGEVVAVLEEHSMHSGCMTINPNHPGMIASCSDDNNIIIWATKELQLELQEADEKWIQEHSSVAMPTIAIKKGCFDGGVEALDSDMRTCIQIQT